MGFKRIEWIFFLAFLGVNVFLFNIFISSRNEQAVVSMKSPKIPIEQRLAAEDIKYDGTLSSTSSSGYYLSGIPKNMQEMVKQNQANNGVPLDDGTTKIDNNRLSYQMVEHFFVQDKNDLGKASETYLKTNVMSGSSYKYQPNFSTVGNNRSEIVAAQTYEGIPLNDPSGQIVFVFSKQGDVFVNDSYTQTFVDSLTPLREKMVVHSEKDAINALYINNRIASKSTILYIQLAYTLILNVRGQNVYVPAWFVSIEKPDKTHQIEVINGFSNRIITNASVRKVEKT